MLFGLGMFAIGMFLVFPAVQRHSFGFYLASATLVGSGLATLEVTAIPLLVFLGRRQHAVQRTVMATSLSSLGGFAALYLGPIFLTRAASAPYATSNLVGLFSTVGAVSIGLAFVMELTPYPAVARARVAWSDHTLASFGPPLRQKSFRLAMAACFLVLFAQNITTGFAWPYSRSVMPSLTPNAAHQVLVWAFLALAMGRFFIPLAMRWISPMRLVVVFAIASAVSAAVTALASGPTAVASIIVTSFFTAILFPAIFANALRNMADMAKSGAAVLMFVAFSGTSVFSLLTPASAILRPLMFLPPLAYAGAAGLAVIIRRAKHSTPAN